MIRDYLRHLTGCDIFEKSSPKACNCGMLRAEGVVEDLRAATDQLGSAVEDSLRRYWAGDPNAIASNLISATLRPAKEALGKAL